MIYMQSSKWDHYIIRGLQFVYYVCISISNNWVVEFSTEG